MATVRETEKALHLSSTEIGRSSWGSHDYRTAQKLKIKVVEQPRHGKGKGKRPCKQELLWEHGSSTYHLNNKPATGNIVT